MKKVSNQNDIFADLCHLWQYASITPKFSIDKMSRIAKFTLISAISISAGVVWGVHYLQKKEKEFMHAGVLRDEERRAKKDKFQQNKLELEQQLNLQREYEKIQPIKKH